MCVVFRNRHCALPLGEHHQDPNYWVTEKGLKTVMRMVFSYFVQGGVPGRRGMISTAAQLGRADRLPLLPGGRPPSPSAATRARSHWLENVLPGRGPSAFEVLGLRHPSRGRADFVQGSASLGEAKLCSIWQEPSACLRNLELRNSRVCVNSDGGEQRCGLRACARRGSRTSCPHR